MYNEKYVKNLAGYNLPVETLQPAFERLQSEKVIERLQEQDHTLWPGGPGEIADRLGWLNSPGVMIGQAVQILDYAAELQDCGYRRILLMGMGGSSLAPEVYRKVLGVRPGFPDLAVLDSTDPDAVRKAENWCAGDQTHFIVSTKSGGTVETLSLLNYFYSKKTGAAGAGQAGMDFTAITDPGSDLEALAEKLSFRRVFLNDPHIGGRFSALSYYGLVPAALIGTNLETLLQSAQTAAKEAGTKLPPAGDNTGAWLGAILGTLAACGRDKVTLIISPPLEPLGAWVEQLLAESTGKMGRGLVPVIGETLGQTEIYGPDRLFIHIRLTGGKDFDQESDALVKAGQPLVRWSIEGTNALGGVLYRWMTATAIAAWLMAVNPFDQPDVEAAKERARQAVTAYRERGELPERKIDLFEDGIAVHCGFPAASLGDAWGRFFEQSVTKTAQGETPGYLAIQAYLTPGPENDRLLEVLREKLRRRLNRAVTLGYGPRYLHSTGQLHKGDAGRGIFIQLTADSPCDLPIPDQPGSAQSSLSFATLKEAQALGDREALLSEGRRVISFHLPALNQAEALEKLIAALED